MPIIMRIPILVAVRIMIAMIVMMAILKDIHLEILLATLVGVDNRMGPAPYGPIMTSSAISKSPIWYQQASHNDVSKQ